ncbi:hypothetical protein JZ751_007021 [Albula glossodonta]|uniref:Ig-like domain-containing protein n=1 Tax=Albula glossodonta TaxID=121402 RepID=A0A8T2PD98_9TELE|nr:hypothetical protein JZ751_007021 [Albula glossodonta]
MAQSFSMHLIPNPTGHHLSLRFNSVEIFKVNNNGVKFFGKFEKCCSFLPDGILKWDKVYKIQSGVYLLEVHDENGRIQQRRNITLTITVPVSPPVLSQHCTSHGEIRVSCFTLGEDPEYSWTLNDHPLDRVPVSPPVLSQHCTSHGEIRVSCFTQGEDPEYSWTLNDHPLDRGVAFLSNETQTVILNRNMSGDLTCTARNLVSTANTTQKVLTCPVFCLIKKKQQKTGQRTPDGRPEEPQELVYSQVTVVKNKNKIKRQQEPDVVYGEVKISGSSQGVRHTAEGQEDIVYARIRT